MYIAVVQSLSRGSTLSALSKFSITLFLLLYVAILLGCEAKSLIEGKKVQKVQTRWGLVWGMPFPGRVWQVYYVYTDDQGNKVKHGPYQSFDGDGRLDYTAFYRDGKLDGAVTRFGHHQEKLQESFYRAGHLVGQANYENGHLVYEHKAVFKGANQVGEIRFENGRWSLSFICGTEIDKRINPITGEIADLAVPFSISCQ